MDRRLERQIGGSLIALLVVVVVGLLIWEIRISIQTVIVHLTLLHSSRSPRPARCCSPNASSPRSAGDLLSEKRRAEAAERVLQQERGGWRRRRLPEAPVRVVALDKLRVGGAHVGETSKDALPAPTQATNQISPQLLPPRRSVRFCAPGPLPSWFHRSA